MIVALPLYFLFFLVGDFFASRDWPPRICCLPQLAALVRVRLKTKVLALSNSSRFSIQLAALHGLGGDFYLKSLGFDFPV